MLFLSNPIFFTAAPVFLSAASVLFILKTDEEPFYPLDTLDPAGWHRSKEWLPGAQIEQQYFSRTKKSVSVTTHSSGTWRTLRRFGSIQSVTLQNVTTDEAIHTTAGNEYVKVMASAYAALTIESSKNPSILHLGLGGGSLPMLLGESCRAVELDTDVVNLAIEYCGVDTEIVNVISGVNALDHKQCFPNKHYSCIFIDVFGNDNNVPQDFFEHNFLKGLLTSLEKDGIVIANFHRGNQVENNILNLAIRTYTEVFGACVKIPSRYQGNVILCARKGNVKLEFDLESATRFGEKKGWTFDPISRLRKFDTIVENQPSMIHNIMSF